MQDIHYNMKHEEKKNQFDGFDCVSEFSLMFCKQKLLSAGFQVLFKILNEENYTN